MAAEFVIGGAMGRNPDVDNVLVLWDANEVEYKIKANSTTGDLEIYRAGTLVFSVAGGETIIDDTLSFSGGTGENELIVPDNLADALSVKISGGNDILNVVSTDSAELLNLVADTVAAGALTSKGATSGIGYSTGAGGAVTQITSASTGVTLNKVCGQITTVALTTAAAAEERFTVTNSTVDANDVVALSTTYNGDGTVLLSVQKMAAGAFDIVISNVHASAAFNAVMVINFVVIKAVAA